MDVTFSMDEGDLALGELVEALESIPGVLERKLEGAAQDIWVRIERAAKENAPADTGNLQNSIRSVVESIGETLLEIRVGAEAEYAAPQEFGTDPFFPPPSALRDWARRVLGDEDLAYPVAQSISETGLDAQPFLVPAFEDNLEWAVDRINDAVEAALREVGLK